MKKVSLYSILSFQVVFLSLALIAALLLTSCRSNTPEETPQPTSESVATSQETPDSMISPLSEETTLPQTAEPLPAATQGVDVTAASVTSTPLPSGLAPVIVSGDFAGEGKPFTFDATASQVGDAPIVGYEWDMGDGTILHGIAVEHAYSSVGVYTVSLTITDESGETATTSVIVEIIELDAGPPVAAIEGPEVVSTGEEVTFSAAGSQPGGDVIVAYQWTSGDGNDTGQTPENTFTTVYDEPGIYFAEVTVIDAVGLTDTAIMEVVVEFSLVGTSWVMDDPIRGTEITLVFGEDTLSGSSGCNDYDANYSTTEWVDNSAGISIKVTNSTNRSCSQEVMGQETGYHSFLQSASQITVAGDILIFESHSTKLTFSQKAA